MQIKGIAFPFRFDGRGKVAMSSGDQHIKESIAQILLTGKGQLLFKPEFGSRIPQRVFDPVNTGALIRADAQEALEKWEKRIKLLKVEVVNTSGTPVGQVRYKVNYQIKGSDELYELIQTQGIGQ